MVNLDHSDILSVEITVQICCYVRRAYVYVVKHQCFVLYVYSLILFYDLFLCLNIVKSFVIFIFLYRNAFTIECVL